MKTFENMIEVDFMKKDSFKISAFYKFTPLTEIEVNTLVSEMNSLCADKGIYGLIIFAKEGVNATIAGSPQHIDEIQELLSSLRRFNGIEFKESFSDFQPFRRLSVVERDEIVTLKKKVNVESVKKRHLSPLEWDKMLKESPDATIIDVRNEYETRIGKFKGALDPKTAHFSEFPDFISKSNLPKDKPILIYCTGGIRCEKAIYEFEMQGYENVFQLDGGILNYLASSSENNFEGECFVFDHRVAVNCDLEPSKTYKLCPLCGDPASNVINCAICNTPTSLCDACLSEPQKNACSKNCAHHLGRAPIKENPHAEIHI